MSRQTWLERNWLLVLIAIALLLLVVVPLLWQYMIAPTVYEQNYDEGQNIAEDTIDAEKALQDYRWFRGQWQAIQEQHEQTQNYEQDLQEFYELYGKDPNEWSRTAETRHGRIQDRITGSQNQEEMLIAEYNAKKADATTAIFACGLPNRVDKKLFITDGAGVDYTSEEAAENTPPEDPTDCKYLDDPDP